LPYAPQDANQKDQAQRQEAGIGKQAQQQPGNAKQFALFMAVPQVGRKPSGSNQQANAKN